MSLVRAISKLGFASRVQAEELVRGGKVSVNGRVVRRTTLWLDPRVDSIAIEGGRLRPQLPVYIAMHKPRGVVTTRSDERGRRTVYDLLAPGTRWVFPVGRLDKETSGLLLLTNDTQFGEQITDPLRKIPKTYVVELQDPLSADDRRSMEQGMTLSDGTQLLPAQVQACQGYPARFELTIREGKNRQIRRMCGDLGHTVLSLKRTSIGPIVLGDLAEGATRPLTQLERAGVIGKTRRRGR